MAATTHDADLTITESKADPTSSPVKPKDCVSLGVGRAVATLVNTTLRQRRF